MPESSARPAGTICRKCFGTTREDAHPASRCRCDPVPAKKSEGKGGHGDKGPAKAPMPEHRIEPPSSSDPTCSVCYLPAPWRLGDEDRCGDHMTSPMPAAIRR